MSIVTWGMGNANSPASYGYGSSLLAALKFLVGVVVSAAKRVAVELTT